MASEVVPVLLRKHRKQLEDWKCADPQALCPPDDGDSKSSRIVNIMVLGQFGSGKSSLINGVKTTLKNDAKVHSGCVTASTPGHCTKWAERYAGA